MWQQLSRVPSCDDLSPGLTCLWERRHWRRGWMTLSGCPAPPGVGCSTPATPWSLPSSGSGPKGSVRILAQCGYVWIRTLLVGITLKLKLTHMVQSAGSTQRRNTVYTVSYFHHQQRWQMWKMYMLIRIFVWKKTNVLKQNLLKFELLLIGTLKGLCHEIFDLSFFMIRTHLGPW